MKTSVLFTLGVSFTIIFTGSLIALLPEGQWLFLGTLIVSTFVLGMLCQTAITEDTADDPDEYVQEIANDLYWKQ